MAAAGGTTDPRPSSPVGYQKAAFGGVLCTILLDSNWVEFSSGAFPTTPFTTKNIWIAVFLLHSHPPRVLLGLK